MGGYDLFATAYDDIIRKGSPLNELQYVLNQVNNVEGKKIYHLGCGQ
ncbi:hypothetical protein [Lederbergia citrea]|uniref:Uncharacterized protein n=1 Tax=Lederbergia citrea TaxID=2833581 RepID=A0A942Z568_9BACI|nr:hypothetical protein [Lederbergia citrea]MBS4178346.1 hypothetical protein [Lederbergia citrea]MBS4223125.1 hypothetical protein [Lederbergia citrea]